MKFLASIIMRGRVQAMAVASSLALLSLILSPVSIVSSATVALVTLRRGAQEGLYILGASIAAAIMGILIGLGGGQLPFGNAFILWLPAVWLLAIVLRERRQLSQVLSVASILGILSVIGFYLFGNPGLYWLPVAQMMIQPMTQAADIPPELLEHMVVILAKSMTGIYVTGSVTSSILSLLLARWWQANLFNPNGFGIEYQSLRMPSRFTMVTILVFILASVGSGIFSELAWNIGIILFMLHTFAGVAVAHALIGTTKAKRFLLPLFYMAVIVIPHVVLLPVSVIGITDTWLNLRKNIKNPSST